MKKPDSKRMWESFLYLADTAEPGGEMAVNGVVDAKEAALVTLRAVRDHVIPLVQNLYLKGAIDWYSYLLHDRFSGVPLPEGDKGVYIHLRYATRYASDTLSLPEPWVMTRKMIDTGTDEDMYGWWLLGEQSMMILDIIKKCVERGLDEMATLQNLGQTLHYFANMTQLRVS